jgi:hypothetical protein
MSEPATPEPVDPPTIAERTPTAPEAVEQSATAERGHKKPEAIRQEIEATKDRISDSVEALAEIKADIDYAKSHPKEVVKEKVKTAKDDMVARVVERKDEIMAHRKAGGGGGGEGAGAKQTFAKAKDAVAKAYESLETKLDDLLGVEVDKSLPRPVPGDAGPPKPPLGGRVDESLPRPVPGEAGPPSPPIP